jgi:2-desacetyl-2-hydroxyethyl bacteriochlorophyllide A dehydrogenase
MQALQFTAIDQLDLVDIEVPTPAPDQVLIRTGAATICTSDLHDLRGNPFGITLPVILGHEGAGTITALGDAVTGLEVGDRVAAHPVHPCGNCDTCRAGQGHLCPHLDHFGLTMQGTFAEYFLARADRVHPLPDSVAFTTAALAEPVCVCLEALHQTNLTTGQRLLILGDGPFGVMMARLARGMGLDRVVIAGRHAGRLGFATGALPVLTMRDEDSRTALRAASDGRGFDAVILAVADPTAVNLALELLRPQGRVVVFAPLPGDTPVNLFDLLLRELEIVGAVNDQDRLPAAIAALADPTLNLGDLITHQSSLQDYETAFQTAEHDRDHAMKVAFTF